MMHSRMNRIAVLNGRRLGAALGVFAIGGILVISACSATPKVQPPASLSAISQVPDARQQVFATPEQAVDALVAAMRNDRQAELIRILGSGAGKLVHSGDRVADKQSRERFLTAYDTAHRIENEDNGHDVLIVGSEEWPMPIPLVRASNGWWFDTATGEQEILNRRIGRNELNVVEVCRAYVEAQQEFAAMHPFGRSKHEYAQKFESTAGRHDGLYWPVAEGQPESPFGPLIATATAEGYASKALNKSAPYHGYYYRILKRQGVHASGGAKNYVESGQMMRGFALIAFPARYGDSGVMSFIVNQNGIVYEKNFGPDTAIIARRITQFDPDNSWSVVKQLSDQSP
jgi:hypothetical protein